jgi:transcriptional regulator with XRE-family HTH domain
VNNTLSEEPSYTKQGIARKSRPVLHGGMDTGAGRRVRLRTLLDGKYGNSQAAFARAAGLSASQVSDLLKGRKAFGERFARRIEGVLGLAAGWFDLGQNGPSNGAVTGAGGEPVVHSSGTLVGLKTWLEVENVEYSREALELARAWLVLPERDRVIFKRQIEAAALVYRAPAEDKAAAPGAARREQKA